MGLRDVLVAQEAPWTGVVVRFKYHELYTATFRLAHLHIE